MGVYSVFIPENLLEDMVQKAVIKLGGVFRVNLADKIGCSVFALQGKRSMRYDAFLELCKISGFNENEVLSKSKIYLLKGNHRGNGTRWSFVKGKILFQNKR